LRKMECLASARGYGLCPIVIVSHLRGADGVRGEGKGTCTLS
jgi:hypothetical protein